jgi:hypothetical protein
MQCDEVRGLLDWYVDGELSPEEKGAVAAHLETCQRCSSELEAVRRGIRLLNEAPQESPPAGLRSRILAQTAQRGSPPVVAWPRWAIKAAAGVILAGAAAAVALTIFVPGSRHPVALVTGNTGPTVKAVAPAERAPEPAPVEAAASAPRTPVAQARVEPNRRVSVREPNSPLPPSKHADKPRSETRPQAQRRMVGEEAAPKHSEAAGGKAVIGPDLPTFDYPADTVPLGEAARLARERAAESDLTDVAKDGGLVGSLSPSLDTQEQTEDLIKAINERLANARPAGSATRRRMPNSDNDVVEVPLMHGRF